MPFIASRGEGGGGGVELCGNNNTAKKKLSFHFSQMVWWPLQVYSWDFIMLFN